MSQGSGDKPRGLIEGGIKSLVGLPRSALLNTQEQHTVATLRGNELVKRQNALIERQGEQGHSDSRSALMEIQAMRRANEDGARAQEASRWAAVESNNRLESLNSSLKSGLSAMADGVGELASATAQMVGVPATKISMKEVVAGNPSIESEVIILAICGGLKTEYRDKLLNSLPYWKRDVINSGLVRKSDAEMENTLLPYQKVFLAELRRKLKTSLRTFKSLENLAQHQMLEYQFHYNLSKTIDIVRTGMVGLVHGVNSLEAQGRTQIEQNQVRIGQGETSIKLKQAGILIAEEGLVEQRGTREGIATLVELEQQASDERRWTREGVLESVELEKQSLAEQRGTREGIVTLVDIGEQSLVEQRGIREGVGIVAENTLAIARGTAAQIMLTQHFGERAGEQRGRQIEVAEGIEGNTAGTYRNTELLTVMARRGNEIAEVTLGVSLEVANGTETLIDLSERAEGAREIIIRQGDVGNRLLGNIADGIDMTNFESARIREEVGRLHVTVSQGNVAAEKRDMLKLQETRRTNDLITANTEMLVVSHRDLKDTLVSMQELHLNENRVRAEERFREGYGRFKKGNAMKAIDIFTESIKYWGNDFRVYFYRGLCYASIDKPEEAEIDLKEALMWAEDEKDPAIMGTIKINLAKLYYKESKRHQRECNAEGSDEKIVQAIRTAQEVYEEIPDSSEAAFKLATYLAAYGLWEDARLILVKIIPKDPEVVEAMLHTEELGEILVNFKNVIAEAQNNKLGDRLSERLSIAMIKDCIMASDLVSATACMEELMKKDATFLLSMKIWEMEELKPMRKQIIGLIIENIDTAEQGGDCLDRYAVAMLAMHFRKDKSEISDFKVFRVFLAGIRNDLDGRAQNKAAILRKLRAMSESGTDTILIINKLHSSGLEWLN